MKVILTADDRLRCYHWAEQYMRCNPNGNHLTDHDLGDFNVQTVEVQMRSKCGEVAMAKALGLDASALKWSPHVPDPGYDLISGGLRVDVKSILPFHKRLMWPWLKNDKYWERKFDVMACARGDENCPEWTVEGWIDKRKFYDIKRVAETTIPGLKEGTWYVMVKEDGVLSRDLDYLLKEF